MYNYSSKALVRKDYIRKDGTAAVILQVIINQHKKVIPLNVHVAPAHFNDELERCKIPRNAKRSQLINGIIHKAKSKAEDIFCRSILEEKPLNKDTFTAYFLNEKLQYDFIIWIEEQIEKEKETKAPGTIGNYEKMLKHFKAFRKEISFQELNYEMIRSFDKHLKNYKLRGRQLSYNYIIGTQKRLSYFINEAIRSGIKLENPYDKFPLVYATTLPSFLTPPQLQNFQELYDSNTLDDIYQKVLRQWLFMAYSSLRISEMKGLKKENVLGSQIAFTSQKTKKSKLIHKVPLNAGAQRMLEQAKGKNGFIFDTYRYDQTFNNKIKFIAENRGFAEKVTAHTARHTFATTFLKLGGKLEVLKKILGHAKIETTMIYAHVTNDDMKTQTDYFNDYFKFS